MRSHHRVGPGEYPGTIRANNRSQQFPFDRLLVQYDQDLPGEEPIDQVRPPELLDGAEDDGLVGSRPGPGTTTSIM